MKILFLFCDMLRANLLKTFNDNIKEKGLMDIWFEKLGGTVFTNCYTPGPDSARSMACMFTGRYPKYNGCVKRLHWSKYYLKDDLFTIFDLFQKHNYQTVLRINKNEERLGFLPPRTGELKTYSYLNDCLNNLKNVFYTNDNVFSFITLTDYHWAINDYDNTSVGDYYGQKHLSNSFGIIFNKFSPDEFDYIFIFSDHGVGLQEEIKKENKLFLINDGRSKIVMLLRKKGDSQIEKRSDLASIMDVLPTLIGIFKDPQSCNLDGRSLLSKGAGDRAVVIEDCSVFKPFLDMVMDLWGVRTENYFYFSNLTDDVLLKVLSPNNYEEAKGDDLLIDNLRSRIEEMSCFYHERRRLSEILKKYKAMEVHRDIYSDGEKRISDRTYLFRLMTRLAKDKYKRW